MARGKVVAENVLAYDLWIQSSEFWEAFLLNPKQTGEGPSFLNWALGRARELSASPIQISWTRGMLEVSILKFRHYELNWPARDGKLHPGGSLTGEWAAYEFSVQSKCVKNEVSIFENAVTFLLDLYSGDWELPNWSDWVADAWIEWCAKHRMKPRMPEPSLAALARKLEKHFPSYQLRPHLVTALLGHAVLGDMLEYLYARAYLEEDRLVLPLLTHPRQAIALWESTRTSERELLIWVLPTSASQVQHLTSFRSGMRILGIGRRQWRRLAHLSARQVNDIWHLLDKSAEPSLVRLFFCMAAPAISQVWRTVQDGRCELFHHLIAEMCNLCHYQAQLIRADERSLIGGPMPHLKRKFLWLHMGNAEIALARDVQLALLQRYKERLLTVHSLDDLQLVREQFILLLGAAPAMKSLTAGLVQQTSFDRLCSLVFQAQLTAQLQA